MIFRYLAFLLVLVLPSVVVVQANDGSSSLETKQKLSDYQYWSGNLSGAVELSKNQGKPEINWKKTELEQNKLPFAPGANWFAFDLSNAGGDTQVHYFSLTNSFALSTAELYIQVNESALTPVSFSLNAGHLRYGRIASLPGEKTTLYMFAIAENQLVLPVNLLSESRYLANEQDMLFEQGLAIGGIIGLSCVILLFFIASGNKDVLILFSYFLVQGLLFSALLGRNLYYYFPSDIFRGAELSLLSLLSSILFLQFIQHLFELKAKELFLYKATNLICLFLLISLPISLLLAAQVSIMASLVIHTLTTLFLLVCAGILMNKMQRLARLFAGMILVQLVFGLLNLFGTGNYSVGIFENNALFINSAYGTNFLLIILLLSRRLHYQLQDTQAMQEQALASTQLSQQSQDELLALQQDAQEQLEVRVQERTLELHIALQELESANCELAKMNTIDELSGLYNRRHYDQKILAEYRRSKRNLTPLSLVLIDIDFFKKVNDTYGHLAGDQCIVWVANHIKQSLKRSSDISCRYGGEEFCLILPDTEPLGAYALGENLRLAIEEAPMIYQNKEIRLTVSCGISTYQQQSDVLPEQIFSAADKALYKAKDSGRNQVQQHIFIDPLISPESSHE